MKKFFSLLAIVSIIAISNCTRIPENNDPVLGIWSKTAIESSDSQQNIRPQREEWIFNDAYLGRYHSYHNNTLDFYTDFQWSEDDGLYTISYPGTDMPQVTVVLKKEAESEMLAYVNGSIFALRE
ncbi:MAG: hypothetical protein HKO09_08835 [Croceitalea sp.]|nr:hypothetical protein [Croceitalea sp.]